MNEIHEIEQDLADDFEHSEIHDFGFVVIQLRQAMVKFWTGVNLKSHRCSLVRLQLKPGHPHRAFDRKNARRRWRGNGLDFQSLRPNLSRFGVERRNEGGKKLIANARPLRAIDFR